MAIQDTSRLNACIRSAEADAIQHTKHLALVCGEGCEPGLGEGSAALLICLSASCDQGKVHPTSCDRGRHDARIAKVS
jgi:hypothetical protein